MDGKEVIQLAAPCGHLFHATCLSKWEGECARRNYVIASCAACPLDRHAYRSVQSVSIPHEKGVPAKNAEPPSAPPWSCLAEGSEEVRRRMTIIDLRINDLLCSALSLEKYPYEDLDYGFTDRDPHAIAAVQDEADSGNSSPDEKHWEPPCVRFSTHDMAAELKRRITQGLGKVFGFHKPEPSLRKTDIIKRIASLDDRLEVYAAALDSKKRLVECIEIVSSDGGEQQERYSQKHTRSRITSELDVLKTVIKNAEKKRAKFEEKWQREVNHR